MISESSKPIEPANPDEGYPTVYTDAPPEAGAAEAPPETRARARAKKNAAEEGVVPPQTPSVGRVVHFLVPKGMTNRDEPVHRAAIVSKVYESAKDRKLQKVDLHVFVCREDYPDQFHPGPIMYVTGAMYSADAETCGTWHWPERV